MNLQAAGRGRVRVLLLLLSAAAMPLAMPPAWGQRPVIRCEIAGEVVYTDLTCAEAHRIATELSPEYRARQALRRGGEMIPAAPPASDASTVTEPATATHIAIALDLPRVSSALGRNPECAHLEQRMALVEAEGRIAMASDAIRTVEERRAVQRHWHRELGC
jgi:hypothetical protein